MSTGEGAGAGGGEATGPPLVGVDFSSSPTRRKPIVVAHGRCMASGGLPACRLDRLEHFTTLDAFSDWLARPGPWIGAFDFPFGLPRELVVALGWPLDWRGLIAHYAALSRAEIRATFAAFCAARPVGGKFAHRACDGPAGSSPSMKWVNPPVAYMLHAGVPRLLAAGVDLPGLHAGDPSRVALEGYPGLVARALVGRRSYKADDRARQTDERRAAREALLAGLEAGGAGVARLVLPRLVVASPALASDLLADAGGDALDATLCLVQAAWASSRAGFGRPPGSDPLEGWIVGA